MRVLIVDDEELARTLIKKYLEDEIGFEVVGEAENGFEGIKLVTQLKPDLLFLDIQMPKLTGFEMLELIYPLPQIIFSTAFDQYAVDAFEKNAVDYLLKPYSKERFLKALHKVVQKKAPTEELQSLIDYHQKNPQQRMVIKEGSKILILPYQDIYYIESEGDYSKIHSSQGKFLKQKTMKNFEELLSPDFLRIHRSYIVNLKQIKKLELYEKNTYSLLLNNGEKIAVSRTGYKVLKETLGW